MKAQKIYFNTMVLYAAGNIGDNIKEMISYVMKTFFYII
jgi:hypothetical protein